MEELNIEIIYKTCKTCNEQKEINKYRPLSKECKKCSNNKDKTKQQRMKKFYINHREFIKKDNLDRYYKNKLNNLDKLFISPSISI